MDGDKKIFMVELSLSRISESSRSSTFNLCGLDGIDVNGSVRDRCHRRPSKTWPIRGRRRRPRS